MVVVPKQDWDGCAFGKSATRARRHALPRGRTYFVMEYYERNIEQAAATARQSQARGRPEPEATHEAHNQSISNAKNAEMAWINGRLAHLCEIKLGRGGRAANDQENGPLSTSRRKQNSVLTS